MGAGEPVPVNEFNTERLAVYDWTPTVEHQAQRLELETALTGLLTTRVLEHLPPSLRPQPGPDGVARWIDARVAESDILLVEQKDNGNLIGLMILSAEREYDAGLKVRIGYLLAEAAWGQGIATELVAGFVAAMKPFKPVQVIGGVDKGNPSSARVLQKAGFIADVDNSHPDLVFYVLVID